VEDLLKKMNIERRMGKRVSAKAGKIVSNASSWVLADREK